MRTIYLCWVENTQDYLDSVDVSLLEEDHQVKFVIDKHYDSSNVDSIARNFDEDVIFFIDYNMKNNDGSGIDGDEIIREIRKFNEVCYIYFYSSNATQSELRDLVKEFSGIKCLLREHIPEALYKIASMQ